MIAVLSDLHLETRCWHEFLKESFKFTVGLLAENSLSADGGEDVGGLAADESKVKFFETGNLRSLEFVKETSDTSVKNANLFFSGNWNVLLLLKQFSEFLTSVKKLLGSSVQI